MVKMGQILDENVKKFIALPSLSEGETSTPLSLKNFQNMILKYSYFCFNCLFISMASSTSPFLKGSFNMNNLLVG
jgi:hypothetical protein